MNAFKRRFSEDNDGKNEREFNTGIFLPGKVAKKSTAFQDKSEKLEVISEDSIKYNSKNQIGG